MGLVALLCVNGPHLSLGDDAPSDLSLIAAVKEQDKEAVARLLEQKADVDAAQPDGATALHWAVHRDDLDAVKLLIEAGANVEATNDFGVTPLSLACTNANAATIEALLEAGADVNHALFTGETPLMTAARTGDVKSVEALLQYEADVNAKEPVREQTALMWALGEKQTAVAKTLIEQGADIHAATKLGFNPLMFAAREGDREAAQLLLDSGADANSADKNELSALHVATIRGHGEIAALLLERGADPNADGPGFTALHWAAGTWETELNGANGIRPSAELEWHRMGGVREGKLELVKALLKCGADPNARLKKNPARFGFTVTRQSEGSTPMVLAAFAGAADVMRLLAKHDADLSLKPKSSLTPLLTAAGVNRFRMENAVPEDDLLAAVKTAVELGADVNETDGGGNSALHGAAWIRSKKIIRYLVEQGADVNVVNKRRQSPIYIAQRDGRFPGTGPKVEHSEIADLLQELSVPAVVKRSIKEWPNLPPHVRAAIESLLRGELENLDKSRKKN